MALTPPSLVLCELNAPHLDGIESFSPFCLKVHRALRAAGLPYARRHAENPASFGALNPTGQVPVLLVDGEPVSDSTRILHRLEALGGRSLLTGLSASERAEAWLWEDFADTSLNGFVVAARWADEDNWPRTRASYFAAMPAPVRAVVPALLRRGVTRTLIARDVWRAGSDACWERLDAILDQADARLADRSFWVGDSLSVADVAVFGQLQSLRTPLTPRQAASVTARRRLAAYLDRVDRATTDSHGTSLHPAQATLS